MFLAADSSNFHFMSQGDCHHMGRTVCSPRNRETFARNEFALDLATSRGFLHVADGGHGHARDLEGAREQRLEQTPLHQSVAPEVGQGNRKVMGRRRSCCVVPPLSKELIDQFYCEESCKGATGLVQGVLECGHRASSCPCTPQSNSEETQEEGAKKRTPSNKCLMRRESLPASLARRLSRTNEEYDIPVLQILSAAEGDERLKGILERLNTMRSPARCQYTEDTVDDVET
ncbi:hypothetical protein GUITHDRAFT_139963 [Guillardia theta CCMP2712]|uniref:Uncharacterized protein n=1 Tax=Guillardia theta (strain CCMP2712) TaxID=905079 RepID=L1J7Q1_GUITC|nr:hypothetical protein GUITHDRAFT_139963 [Guillardia theta CCMP2712]EKX44110.1 hypothetical protein GUITHDRAFT_139963 [Guillardia theta CCMP2712]|eukprot:XP_005831090.1 hypothetical protein GUITHDRAFT_139963 [Guillardia theta CCMP2712]